MPTDYASSITGVVLRVSRLTATSALAVGPSASYVTAGFLRASFTPEFEEGDEFTEKNAAGVVCTTFKAPDTLKRITLELAICDPDPEFTEILAGGSILTDEGETVGYASPLSQTDGNPNGVALEVWSQAVVGGKPAAVNPYWRWVFPYVKMRASGDRTIENGILANAFEGYGVGNSAFGTGPGGTWPFISDRPYQYARTDAAPLGSNGYREITAPVGP